MSLDEGADNLPPLNRAIASLESSQIVELWRRGMGREDLIPLYVGEGDQPTPQFIADAAHEAMLQGYTFYSPKRGLPELREALSDYMGRHFGVAPALERVSVTTAGMNAIMLALQATLNPGDRMTVVTPCWPNIIQAARIVGAEPTFLAMRPAGDGTFSLDLEALFTHCRESRSRVIFLVSPSNPTGWIITPEEQRALLAFCRQEGIWLIADEVYHRFIFDGRAVAPSFLQVAEEDDPLFIVNSFSKTWAMTGWRLGWLIHPVALADVLEDLIEFNTSGSQAFSHRGVLAGLAPAGEAWVRENIDACRLNAELVFQGLAAIDRVKVARPIASFYAFFAVEGMSDSFDFCVRLLEKTGVGLAPGASFGPGGEGHVRLCFASNGKLLGEAISRLTDFLD